MALSRKRRFEEVHGLLDYEEPRIVEEEPSLVSLMRTSPSKRSRITEGMDDFKENCKIASAKKNYCRQKISRYKRRITKDSKTKA